MAMAVVTSAVIRQRMRGQIYDLGSRFGAKWKREVPFRRNGTSRFLAGPKRLPRSYPDPMRIAFLGLGTMGAGMAGRLGGAEDAQLTVWNRRRERAAAL